MTLEGYREETEVEALAQGQVPAVCSAARGRTGHGVTMHPEDPGAGSQSVHATAWSSRHPPAFPSRGNVSREAAATLPYLVLLLCAASTGSLRSARLH